MQRRWMVWKQEAELEVRMSGLGGRNPDGEDQDGDTRGFSHRGLTISVNLTWPGCGDSR